MDKVGKLKRILQRLNRVVIAYSGGLDSTFLLKMAVDTLGRSNVLAVTARSETYPISEYREAVTLAKRIGARQLTINTGELKIKEFKTNPVNRCYYCKKELFKELDEIRKKQRFNFVLDGTNIDDLRDVRYGRRAAKELGVRSPLLEAGLTKDNIRQSSKRLKLPTWDKPSFACLASRVPFGNVITNGDLLRIEGSEAFLQHLGFKQVRVRSHKDIARIEVLKKDFKRAVKLQELIIKKLKSLGFVYITLDLCGYRTGSMHEAANHINAADL
ncbi:MAG: ATP-dependent sacrificial sulfur transferase LarE [Candidatus Omnitrophota bacterium]|jgi:uncharacterized protein